MNDHSLVDRIKDKDHTALAEIYTTFREEFISYAQRYHIDRDELLDIYQDAVVALYQNFTAKSFQLESSGIKTYLFGIGKNKIASYFKAKKKIYRSDYFEDEYEEISFPEEELNYQQRMLAKYFPKLGLSCQEILKMYYYRNWTIKEIVAFSHYKDENTVKSHKSRCLKKLKSFIPSVS